VAAVLAVITVLVVRVGVSRRKAFGTTGAALSTAAAAFHICSHQSPANPTTVVSGKLYPQMQRPDDRCPGPTTESRDFTVSLRAPA
jgi:hypothetical protein